MHKMDVWSKGIWLLRLVGVASGHGALNSPTPRNAESNSSNAMHVGTMKLVKTGTSFILKSYLTSDCTGYPSEYSWAADECKAIDPSKPKVKYAVSLTQPASVKLVDCTAENDCTGWNPKAALAPKHHDCHQFSNNTVSNVTDSSWNMPESDGIIFMAEYTASNCQSPAAQTLKMNINICTKFPYSANMGSAGCEGMACMWFSQGCMIGCSNCTEDNDPAHFLNHVGCKEPTINDPQIRTFNIDNQDPVGDWTKAHPWRAPGSAPVLDACGLAGGSTKNNDAAGGFAPPGHKQGDKGSALPIQAMHPTWKAGSVVEVAWGIAANHGGGYLYRLCPAEKALTEECFMQTPLEFAGKTQVLRFANGTQVQIPATLVTDGVLPAGSTWMKNPIPACHDYSGGFHEAGCERPQFTPPVGCDAKCWGYQDNLQVGRVMPSIVDQLKLPADLPEGKYVLGWRWDCEQTPQVWASCADIVVTSDEKASTYFV
eukprot:gnl/MRDRNA2_/MRDRNA2_18697_c0_seq1.p1 gnl/MRDRNA2_/MRDRNA2_18697_c0~~gnl/MRDRNA2_/MRDRNA2_18697_c0_seq1.p1  ORF type:complete len:485 (+),score=83.95 gnl/MRDRNA2_/MRDRNA2_18697_c0_seq1:68-1522(+)